MLGVVKFLQREIHTYSAVFPQISLQTFCKFFHSSCVTQFSFMTCAWDVSMITRCLSSLTNEGPGAAGIQRNGAVSSPGHLCSRAQIPTQSRRGEAGKGPTREGGIATAECLRGWTRRVWLLLLCSMLRCVPRGMWGSLCKHARRALARVTRG